MMCVQRARGETVTHSTWTHYFKYFFYVLCVTVIVALLEGLPNLFASNAEHRTHYFLIAIFNFLFYITFNFLMFLAVIITVDQRINPI